jgi:hypothetical protein
MTEPDSAPADIPLLARESQHTPETNDHDCHCGDAATDISTERLKAVTDRLDVMNANIGWLCQVVHSIISTPRGGVAGLVMNKVLPKN